MFLVPIPKFPCRNGEPAGQGRLDVGKVIEGGGRSIEVSTTQRLGVGALGLDVARLLALIADLLAATGVLRAVAGEVARLAAVVALRAVDAVALRSR